MVDRKPVSPAPSQKEKTPPGTREERLAAALRANLRRRKAQARERGAPETAEPKDADKE